MQGDWLDPDLGESFKVWWRVGKETKQEVTVTACANLANLGFRSKQRDVGGGVESGGY